jgi:hypothetical protein
MRSLFSMASVSSAALILAACSAEGDARTSEDVATDTAEIQLGVRTLSNIANQECITVRRGAVADGVTIGTAPCVSKRDAGDGRLGTWNQRWNVARDADFWVSLVDGSSGQCLGIENGRLDNGAHAVLQPCDGRDAQRFRTTSGNDEGTHAPAIYAKHSGRCLDVELDTGTVVQWDCHLGVKQQWSFVGTCFKQQRWQRGLCTSHASSNGVYSSEHGCREFLFWETGSYATLDACVSHPVMAGSTCTLDKCSYDVCVAGACDD